MTIESENNREREMRVDKLIEMIFRDLRPPYIDYSNKTLRYFLETEGDIDLASRIVNVKKRLGGRKAVARLGNLTKDELSELEEKLDEIKGIETEDERVNLIINYLILSLENSKRHGISEVNEKNVTRIIDLMKVIREKEVFNDKEKRILNMIITCGKRAHDSLFYDRSLVVIKDFTNVESFCLLKFLTEVEDKRKTVEEERIIANYRLATRIYKESKEIPGVKLEAIEFGHNRLFVRANPLITGKSLSLEKRIDFENSLDQYKHIFRSQEVDFLLALKSRLSE